MEGGVLAAVARFEVAQLDRFLVVNDELEIGVCSAQTTPPFAWDSSQQEQPNRGPLRPVHQQPQQFADLLGASLGIVDHNEHPAPTSRQSHHCSMLVGNLVSK